LSENRHPPVGSKPEGKLFRIMLLLHCRQGTLRGS
jgi:hypothetical protein